MRASEIRHTSLATAVGRWAGLGPYYAMFPSEFAFEVVEEFSTSGSAVLDPFAGRASSIYAAAATGRTGLGIEVNPVGWLYGRVKLRPASKSQVLSRINEIALLSKDLDDASAKALPEFFAICYTPRVLRFLITARQSLRWQVNSVDATLMAIILVHLHGKRCQSLSNQMRQGKAMSPAYSVRWWMAKGLEPPDIDPVGFMIGRIERRYSHGSPPLGSSSVLLGDSIELLPRVAQSLDGGELRPFDLLFTSPPYYAVTNYNYDQWLRLWMLGGPDHPTQSQGPWRGRFAGQLAYNELLHEVFTSCASMMSRDAVVYVRTDARSFTFQTTIAALSKAFPAKRITTIERPLARKTQTALFGDKSEKPGEIDIILR